MNARAASKTFDFKTHGIADVLKSHRLAVPPYQREYAWDADRVDQLYDDLALAHGEHKHYFLGTIVTIPHPAENILEIIDGQQRLTSTALLLTAIRNYLRVDGSAPMVVESIENEFLTTIDRARGERVPRLTLNVDDNEFFRNMVNSASREKLYPTRQSHRLLVAAQETARRRILKITGQVAKQSQVDILNAWLEFLEQEAQVILVTAPDGAQAYRMFETLNDRGLKTSQADLVKSFLFGQADRRITEAQSKWSSMRRMLEEIDDEDRDINFLRHTLIATKQPTRADDVYTAVQKFTRGEAAAISFLSDLENLSRAYVATYRTESEHWADHLPKTLQAIRVLNKFDIRPLRPLMLAIALRFKGKDAAGAFQFLVTLGVRLLIAASTRSGSIEEAAGAAALAIYRGEIKTLGELKGNLSKITPDNRVFREAFARATSNKADFARYYLRCLENAFAQEAEPWKLINEDPTEITVEHILPKSPVQNEWPGFDVDQLQEYSRRLGNMCLLQKTPNSNARSGKFADKCDLYRASPLKWTNELAELSRWDAQSVDDRQTRMAELAVKAWPT